VQSAIATWVNSTDRNDLAKAIDLLQENGSREPAEMALQVEFLNRRGWAARCLGQLQKNRQLTESSAAIAQQLNIPGHLAQSLIARSLAYSDLADFERAQEDSEKALEIARQIGDLKIQARALWMLGVLRSRLGSIDQAIEMMNESLALSRLLGDREGEANAIKRLGLLALTLLTAKLLCTISGCLPVHK